MFFTSSLSIAVAPFYLLCRHLFRYIYSFSHALDFIRIHFAHTSRNSRIQLVYFSTFLRFKSDTSLTHVAAMMDSQAASAKRGQDEYLAGDASRNQWPPQPAAKKIKLANTRATDLANNSYAPPASDAQALAAYRQEVGTNNLFLTRTPLQTNSSSVKLPHRQIIHERLFLGWTNAQCGVTYVQHEGCIGSGEANMSKLFLNHAPEWFEEENVVLPWATRGKNSRIQLAQSGLGPENFPFLHHCEGDGFTISGVTATPKGRKVKANSELVSSSLPMHDPFERAAPTHEIEEDESEGEDDIQQMDDSNSEPEKTEDEVFLRHAEQLQRDEDEAHYYTYADCMRDRVRAALNTFGPELASFSEGEVTFTVSQAALLKHCKIFKEHPGAEIDMATINPNIVRAFISSIAPCPGNGLPTHDYIFPVPEYGANSKDMLGVMSEDVVNVRDFNWDLHSCRKLYEFAITMRCDMVMDMVVDKVCEIYEAHVNTETVLEFPEEIVKHVNQLEHEDDQPFLRLLVDVMIDQDTTPDGLNSRVTALIAQRKDNDTYKSSLYPNDQADYCTAYHLHGPDKACYRTQALKIPTAQLIAQFYTHLRAEAPAAYQKVADSIPTDNFVTAGHALRRHHPLQWSHSTEAATALSLLELERLKRYAKKKAKRGETIPQKYIAERNAYVNAVKQNQATYAKHWKHFNGNHQDCTHDEEEKKKTKEVLVRLDGRTEEELEKKESREKGGKASDRRSMRR